MTSNPKLLRLLARSGPGWLQSAITLGAGTLASSLFLGVIGGYAFLWVQPAAMLTGVIMLGAIAYATLAMERSPFDAMRRDFNPVLAWGWLLGALVNNTIYSLPQFAVSYAALTENLFPSWLGGAESLGAKIGISVVLLAIVAGMTLVAQSGARGVRIYENLLKGMVGMIVLAFVWVVVLLTLEGRIAWSRVLAGLVPSMDWLRQPAGAFAEALAAIPGEDARSFWAAQIRAGQTAPVVGAVAAAVGINMTFLLPYSLLARGWGRESRRFALWDLAGGMVLPFAFTTACIVLAAASQFHGQVPEGLVPAPDGALVVAPVVTDPTEIHRLEQHLAAAEKRLAARAEVPALAGQPVSPEEYRLAALLVARNNADLAQSLERLTGNRFVAQKVFGFGVLAMALSTVSILMLTAGFIVREAFGGAPGGRAERLGGLLGGIGIFWPLLWDGNSKVYLAVVVGLIGYTLLPLAFVAFFALMNSRRLLGEHRPRGRARWIWNTLMIFSLLVSGGASVSLTWTREINGFPVGPVVLIAFILAALAGQRWFPARRRR